MNEAIIRDTTSADLERVAEIYAHEAEHGISTFDVVGRPPDFWQQKLASPEPFLVATAGDAVLGYANASVYRPRAAYDRTREVSVYLAPEGRGRGAGRSLYDGLLGRLRSTGTHTVLAVIALPNDASIGLHTALGFAHAGTLHAVGRKFDRWIDTALYELLL